jgi:hypothetical protein
MEGQEMDFHQDRKPQHSPLWLANIIAGAIETLAVILLQLVVPLANGAWHEHMFALYMFFGTIETVSSGRRGLGQGLRLSACRNWSLK